MLNVAIRESEDQIAALLRENEELQVNISAGLNKEEALTGDDVQN